MFSLRDSVLEDDECLDKFGEHDGLLIAKYNEKYGIDDDINPCIMDDELKQLSPKTVETMIKEQMVHGIAVNKLIEL